MWKLVEGLSFYHQYSSTFFVWDSTGFENFDANVFLKGCDVSTPSPTVHPLPIISRPVCRPSGWTRPIYPWFGFPCRHILSIQVQSLGFEVYVALLILGGPNDIWDTISSYKWYSWQGPHSDFGKLHAVSVEKPLVCCFFRRPLHASFRSRQWCRQRALAVLRHRMKNLRI